MGITKSEMGLLQKVALLEAENALLRKTIANTNNGLELFELIIANMQQGVLFVSSDHLIVRANEAVCKIYGIEHPSEIVGQDCRIVVEKIAPNFRFPDQFIENIILTTRAQEVVMSERIELRDGRVVFRDYRPLLQHGEFVGSLWLYEDRTSAAIATEKLIESELRWKFAIEGNNNGLWDWNIKTDAVFYSPVWKSMLGFEEHEITSSAREWDSRIHPEDKEATLAALESHSVGNLAIYESEYRMLCKDESYKWILARGKIISYNDYGEPIRMIGTHSDISQRKKDEKVKAELNQALSDERQMLVQGNVVVIKWRKEPGWPVEYVSPNVINVLGYSASDFHDTAFKYNDLVHRSDIGYVMKELKEGANLAAGYICHAPYRVMCATGEYIWVSDYSIICKNNAGEVTHYLGYLMDISAQVAVEGALRNSQKELLISNATKDKFFTIIAHDLRNPFTSIVGFSDLIVDDLTAGDYENIGEYARIIQESAELSMDLLTNLLTWSRAQRGKLTKDPSHFDIAKLADEVISIAAFSAGRKNIVITTNYEARSNVFADRKMIATIIRNLISNAIKFTPAGGKVRVEISGTPSDVYVKISDSGVGIPEDVIETLFDFNHVSSRKGTSDEPGTGLGLVLCKEFVTLHNGSISIDSEVGAGSTFNLTFPVE